MTIVTYDAIMQFAPCYNPIDIGMPIDYSDTLLNFVKEYRHKVRYLQDINWIACRFLDKKTCDYYTWWCVNEIKHLMKDERSIKAVDTLKLYIDGRVTVQELKVAYAAAYAAAYAVDYDAAADYDASVAYAAYAAAYDAASVAYDGASVASVAHAYAKVNQSNLQIDNLIKILESG